MWQGSSKHQRSRRGLSTISRPVKSLVTVSIPLFSILWLASVRLAHAVQDTVAKEQAQPLNSDSNPLSSWAWVIASVALLFLGIYILRVRKTIAAKEKTIENLKRADRVKTEFLARVNQEMRTPLNPIINIPAWLCDGFAPVMCVVCSACEEAFETDVDADVTQIEACPECGAKGSLDFKEIEVYHRDVAEIKTQLLKVLQAGMRLKDIAGDLQSFSKLQTGQHNLTFEQVEVILLFNQVANKLKSLADPHRVRIDTANVPQQLKITTDRKLITQVLYTLGKHAVSISPERKTVHLQAENRENGAVLTVRSLGFTDSEELRDSLFPGDPAETDGSRGSYPGAGLTLTLAKHIVELCGGKMWIESDEAKGSAFFVELPAHSEIS